MRNFLFQLVNDAWSFVSSHTMGFDRYTVARKGSPPSTAWLSAPASTGCRECHIVRYVFRQRLRFDLLAKFRRIPVGYMDHPDHITTSPPSCCQYTPWETVTIFIEKMHIHIRSGGIYGISLKEEMESFWALCTDKDMSRVIPCTKLYGQGRRKTS